MTESDDPIIYFKKSQRSENIRYAVFLFDTFCKDNSANGLKITGKRVTTIFGQLFFYSSDVIYHPSHREVASFS